jgi:hypothetical protein
MDKDTGKYCIGCGDQEEFYGCADVAIVVSFQAQQHTTQTSSYMYTSTTTKLQQTTTKLQQNIHSVRVCTPSHRLYHKLHAEIKVTLASPETTKAFSEMSRVTTKPT